MIDKIHGQESRLAHLIIYHMMNFIIYLFIVVTFSFNSHVNTHSVIIVHSYNHISILITMITIVYIIS